MPQYIGFKLDGSEYTIPILKVREIVNTPAITRLPQSPPYMVGIINLRGNIIPVMDLKALVAKGTTGVEGSKVIVVAGGRARFGILVDSITSVISIEDSQIELPENFMDGRQEQVQGVARLSDRMVIMLDAGKLVDMEALEQLPGAAGGLKEAVGSQVEPPAVAHDVKEAIGRQVRPEDPRHKLVSSVVEIIDRLASNDYEHIDGLIAELLQSPEGELYKEIGRVARKLHESIRKFREMLDPKFKRFAGEEVPEAADRLQFVMKKTEEAANRTITIAEKYITDAKELSAHVGRLKGPVRSIGYLKEFSRSLKGDMTEVLLAQEFQDVAEQTLRKVLVLVCSLEEELVRLVARFGVKMEQKQQDVEEKIQGRITQGEVDEILKEFGF